MKLSKDYHDYEEKITSFCLENGVEPTPATIYQIVIDTFKKEPIKKKYLDKERDVWTEKDITSNVAWAIESDPRALGRILAKIEYQKDKKDTDIFKKNLQAYLDVAKPDLNKLVDAAYQLNISDGPSYLSFIYFIMQVKQRFNLELPNDDKIAVFFNGIARSGKSATARALMAILSNYCSTTCVNSADTLTDSHELALWKSHLAFCDEVIPSQISRSALLNAINGGEKWLNPKNKDRFKIQSKTNFIFCSNEEISMLQRRISVVKFAQQLNSNMSQSDLENIVRVIFESLPDWDFSHREMYKSICESNQNQLNPLGFESICSYVATKLSGFKPNEKEEITFSSTNIIDQIKQGFHKEFIKSERREAIKNSLQILLEKKFLSPKKYESSTTKFYTMNVGQYYAFRSWFDPRNTSQQKINKISKEELHNLLAPYFGTPTPPNNGSPKDNDGTSSLDLESDLSNGTGTESTTEESLSNQEIKELSIDLETYSDVDLPNCGVYKYAESPSFDILLFGYSVNNGSVRVIDLANGETIPENILRALTDNTVIKWAFNANFERVCLSNWLQKHYPDYFKGYTPKDGTNIKFLDPISWHCSAVWSSTLGLPRSLKDAGKTLGLTHQKLDAGRELIAFFSSPCKPTKKNDNRTRNLPKHDSCKWELFKKYNIRDVEVELEIKKALQSHPVSDELWKEYVADQTINDRGVKIDLSLAKKAIELSQRATESDLTELKSITGLQNPNSVTQFKTWLKTKGVTMDNLDEKAIRDFLPQVQGEVAEALKLKLQLAKNSVKKYSAMLNTVSNDTRARGCLMFHNAVTGRWTSNKIQFQNLPKPAKGSDINEDRSLVLNSDYDTVKAKTPNIRQLLSGISRTAIIPEAGHKLIVADYSAIEARVLSVMAGEQWRIEAFKSGQDIYCASASQMFGVPVVKNGTNGELRVKGKIAELALGYGGSVGALKNMGALDMGLKEDELEGLVASWRKANPKIKSYWTRCGVAAIRAVENKGLSEVGNIRFYCPNQTLFIILPSGRRIAYRNACVQTNKNGFKEIVYTSSNLKKTPISGPKFVENIIQGISRDILAHALLNLFNYKVIFHVHDEIIVEVPMETEVKTIENLMCKVPDWIKDLPLKAEGFKTPYYRKD